MSDWKLRKGQWVRKTSEDEKDDKSKSLYCCILGCEKASAGKHAISAHLYYTHMVNVKKLRIKFNFRDLTHMISSPYFDKEGPRIPDEEVPKRGLSNFEL
jgi:hypothetical protein